MSRITRFAGALAIGLLAVALYAPAPAEVSVRTDVHGNYASTQIITTGARGEPVVWGLHGRVSRRHDALNPRGDQRGDLWPEIAESPVAPHHPVVVWSRFGGEDYDLVWSRWNPGGWQPILWLERESAPGQDLDPHLSFNEEGRPYVVWSREQKGAPSQVYLSVFLLSRWMTPVAISEPGVDSRRPVIVAHQGDEVDVEIETPNGLVLQRVMFSRPVTITDDINPLAYISIRSTPNYRPDDSGSR